MSRRRIRSKEHVQRRQAARWRRLKVYAILGFLILALLIGVTHWSAIQIREVTTKNSEDISTEEITELTESILEEPWLGVISRNNILLLPREKIQQQIQAVSPRIQTVDIDLAGLRAIRVEVINRQPVAKICSTASGSTNACYLADETGYLLGTAEEAQATSTDYLRYETNSELKLRDQFLTADIFSALESFTQALEEIELYPNRARIEEYGDVTITVTNTGTSTSSAENSVELKVNAHEDLSQVLQNLQTVIENQSFVAESDDNETSTEPASPFELEYIDLRFENKVFYK